jgi:two-component system sensor histidine kinase QseC
MNSSLKTRLLRNLLFSLVVVWAATLVLGYFVTERTLNRELDAQLKQIAQSLVEGAASDITSDLMSETTIERTHDESIVQREGKNFEFQIWRDDKMIRFSGNAPKETLSQSDGYSQNQIGEKKWRVFSTPQGNSKVMVGQDLDIRKDLIHGMILSSLWPMIVAVPFIVLILWLSVNFALRPLSLLASAIGKRSPKELSKIALRDIPQEVAPVIESLNSLFVLVEQALEREREFADNAAHELRTPLAGIKAQTEAGLLSKSENEKNESLQSINSGVDRASKMVTQLLALARLEPENLRSSFSAVNLNSLVKRVISKLTPQALLNNIDMGLEANDSFLIRGDVDSLEVLISNLLDNAIRYSPPSGKIDIFLKLQDSTTVMIVEDQGQGISEEDRERVFNRFVRLGGSQGEGSGIGLAVVKRIADLHHAQIVLEVPSSHKGLKVTVMFSS